MPIGMEMASGFALVRVDKLNWNINCVIGITSLGWVAITLSNSTFIIWM